MKKKNPLVDSDHSDKDFPISYLGMNWDYPKSGFYIRFTHETAPPCAFQRGNSVINCCIRYGREFPRDKSLTEKP